MQLLYCWKRHDGDDGHEYDCDYDCGCDYDYDYGYDYAYGYDHDYGYDYHLYDYECARAYVHVPSCNLSFIFLTFIAYKFFKILFS
jgi:hypothetical protein